MSWRLPTFAEMGALLAGCLEGEGESPTPAPVKPTCRPRTAKGADVETPAETKPKADES